ncbi:GntR family transcriptional regulator [Pseudoroseicyclus sp. CXY001]|uniref:GntR family transcriptional regulator n=1 Tax=Pseudoroseicyclus sp. CXY001 TaxID=3242492 RepID=UPI003570D651
MSGQRTERAYQLQPQDEDAAAKGASLADQAHAAIRQRIISCEMLPGSEFIEADLAGELQMSKTPVREALLRLQVEGLVQAIPRRGYQVTPIHISDIDDIFDFRLAIEGDCAALAAERAGPEAIDELDYLADATNAEQHKLAGNDIDRISAQNRLNNVFHESVALAAGNARLHRTAVQVLREFERFFFLEWNSPALYAPDHKDHYEIVRHIRAGDAAQARATMVGHVDSSRQALLSVLTSQSRSLGWLTRI